MFSGPREKENRHQILLFPIFALISDMEKTMALFNLSICGEQALFAVQVTVKGWQIQQSEPFLFIPTFLCGENAINIVGRI